MGGILVEQKLITRPENTSSPPVLVGFVLFDLLCVCFVDHFLSFFFWPLCCLSFFDLRIPITPLVSSNSSYEIYIYLYIATALTTGRVIHTVADVNIQ